MTEAQGELAIQLEAGSDVDDEELADLADRLRDELLELDVDKVVPAAAGDAPANVKGAELLSIGGLLVQFVLRPDVLRSIVRGVRSWLGRQRVRSVKLTLDGDTCEVTGLTSVDQERLIDLWIARHAGAG